ncbi:MAG TPA: YdcF family protein [Candidatus Limnocylindrales bacterium]|nr:YdcF family protein [Candidatus Limnocylindrales bacterium]
MVRDLVRLGLVGLLGGVIVTAYAIARIWQQGEIDEARPAGAIVVLGAAQYDGRPSQVFSARLEHATALYAQGLAPYFVVTGGNRPGDRTTEAAVARAYAISRGVPPNRILVEDEARTTLESMRGVSRLLRGHDIDDAIFVSDPTHMLRVLRMAADEGIRAYGSPTRTSPIESNPASKAGATIHELGALAVYLVAGSSLDRDLTETGSPP